MNSRSTVATPLPSTTGVRFAATALSTLRRRGEGPIDPAAVRYLAPAFDRDRLRAFSAALEYPDPDGVPLGFLYLLAQRAQVGLVLGPRFPCPLLGGGGCGMNVRCSVVRRNARRRPRGMRR